MGLLSWRERWNVNVATRGPSEWVSAWGFHHNATPPETARAFHVTPLHASLSCPRWKGWASPWRTCGCSRSWPRARVDRAAWAPDWAPAPGWCAHTLPSPTPSRPSATSTTTLPPRCSAWVSPTLLSYRQIKNGHEASELSSTHRSVTGVSTHLPPKLPTTITDACRLGRAVWESNPGPVQLFIFWLFFLCPSALSPIVRYDAYGRLWDLRLCCLHWMLNQTRPNSSEVDSGRPSLLNCCLLWTASASFHAVVFFYFTSWGIFSILVM